MFQTLTNRVGQVAAALNSSALSLDGCSEHTAPCFQSLYSHLVCRRASSPEEDVLGPDRSGGSVFRLSSGR